MSRIPSLRWGTILLFVFRRRRPMQPQTPASMFLHTNRNLASFANRSVCPAPNVHPPKPVAAFSKRHLRTTASSIPKPRGSMPPGAKRQDSRAAVQPLLQHGELSTSTYPLTSMPRSRPIYRPPSSATGSRAVIKRRGPGARAQQRLWGRRFSDTTTRPHHSRHRFWGTCRFTDLSREKAKPTLESCAGSDPQCPRLCQWNGKRTQTPQACRSPRDCPSPGA